MHPLQALLRRVEDAAEDEAEENQAEERQGEVEDLRQRRDREAERNQRGEAADGKSERRKGAAGH